MCLPGSFPVKDNSFPSWLFCSPFPVPYTQVGLLLSMLETDPKATGKTKNGLCLFLQSFNWVSKERTLVKRVLLWVIQSLRRWGRKGGEMLLPHGRLVAGATLPTQLQGAVSAQSQGLKKSNRKNSFGQMRIWTEEVLIFFSQKVALVNFALYPQLLIKTKWKQHNSLKPIPAFLKWPFHL